MNKHATAGHQRRNELKTAYRSAYTDLLRLFHAADPIGLGDCPPDEYGPEVETVLPRLANCTGPADVRAVLHEEFTQWFGAEIAGSEAAYRDLAARVWRKVGSAARDV